MDRKHRKSEKLEPSPQPIEPEMDKDLENEEHSRTPETEPPKDKRSDEL